MSGYLSEERGFLKKIVVFIIVLITLFAVNGYIVYHLYSTSEMLVEARIDTFVKEFEGKVLALDDYLSQRIKDLERLIKSPAVSSYYNNKALGMSPQYGLSVSLDSVNDEFNRVQEIATDNGRPVYSGIAYFDLLENRIIAKSNSVGEISDLESKVKAWGDSNAEGFFCTNDEKPKEGRRTFVFRPFRYRGDVEGYVLMELDGVCLNKILGSSVENTRDDYSALIDGEGKVFIGPAAMRRIDVRKIFGISSSLPQFSVFKTLQAPDEPAGTLMGALGGLSDGNLYLMTVVPRSRYYAGHSYALWIAITLSLMASMSLMVALIYKGSVEIVRINQSLQNKVAELNESEERTRLLLESSVEGFVGVNVEQEIIFVNRAAAAMLGYEIDELVGRDLELVIHRCHEEGLTYVPENHQVHDSISRGVTCNVDNMALCRKDGSSFPVDLSSNPIHKQGQIVGCVITFNDITDRKRAAEALRDSEEKFQTVADFTYNWEYWIAPDNRLLYVSPSCERITGYRPDEFVDNPGLIREIIVAEDLSSIGDDMKLKDTGTPQETEFRIVCRSGEIRWIGHAAQTVYGKDGTWLGLRVSNRDITKRKLLEADRLEMVQELSHAQRLESLSAMAKGIAHDFNNLLMAIMGNLELALTDQDLSAMSKKAIENAMEATDRSAELSQQMLIYSGKSLYVPRDLDLTQIVNKLLEDKNDLLESVVSKVTTLHFEIGKNVALIRGDENQIQRVITNLVINGAESLGDTAGDVTIRTGQMYCDAEHLSQSRLSEKPSPGLFVFLEVVDTGCGMDAETQRRLFDPFFTTKFWGRGLGMAEVNGTVKGHSGAIIVKSEPGKGTTIRILLPAAKMPQPDPVQLTGPAEDRIPVPETAIGRRTILVVEDEESVRGMLLMRLDNLGYHTLAAADGEEGISLFRAHLNEIDLVLLDFLMPGMNGVEVFEELIKMKPDVKVILSSGYTKDVVWKSFVGKRPAGFLNKPYKAQAVKDALDRLLGPVG